MTRTAIRILFSFCLLALAMTCVQAQAVIESEFAEHDTTLDTNPSAMFWRAAHPVYAESDNSGRPVPEYRTEIVSRWTTEAIYFLFACPYKQLYLKPSPNVKDETYELWNWNVAEVFIGSDFSDIKKYKEFEVSPNNEWVDLDIDLNAPHHEDGWKWNSGFQHATRIDVKKHVWYAALRIPFKSLSSKPAEPGTTFRVNFYRTEGGPKDTKEIMWQTVMGPSFHVPEKFALLRLTKK
jgi:hypothetical protein